jgi:hypothetical protein
MYCRQFGVGLDLDANPAVEGASTDGLDVTEDGKCIDLLGGGSLRGMAGIDHQLLHHLGRTVAGFQGVADKAPDLRGSLHSREIEIAGDGLQHVD